MAMGKITSSKCISLSSSCNYDNSSSSSTFYQRSMSKWLGLVLMLMMVICQLPSSEGKSIYGSGPAMAVAIDEQHGGSGEPEEGQQQQRGLHLAEKAREGPAAEVTDIFDYGGGNRDDYNDGGIPLENAFLNFLYTRQMLQRLRSPAAAAAAMASPQQQQSQFALEPMNLNNPYLRQRQHRQQQQQGLFQDEGIRKRTSSYWKQCAFNAVSCFG